MTYDIELQPCSHPTQAPFNHKCGNSDVKPDDDDDDLPLEVLQDLEMLIASDTLANICILINAVKHVYNNQGCHTKNAVFCQFQWHKRYK